MSLRHTETLEILAGERTPLGPARRRAALRIEDLEGILQLSERLQSATVSGTPTAVEFNALVADVHSIHQRLLAISQAVTARLV